MCPQTTTYGQTELIKPFFLFKKSWYVDIRWKKINIKFYTNLISYICNKNVKGIKMKVEIYEIWNNLTLNFYDWVEMKRKSENRTWNEGKWTWSYNSHLSCVFVIKMKLKFTKARSRTSSTIKGVNEGFKEMRTFSWVVTTGADSQRGKSDRLFWGWTNHNLCTPFNLVISSWLSIDLSHFKTNQN